MFTIRLLKTAAKFTKKTKQKAFQTSFLVITFELKSGV